MPTPENLFKQKSKQQIIKNQNNNGHWLALHQLKTILITLKVKVKLTPALHIMLHF